MIDDLRNGTSSKGDHRGPVGHRFDEHQAERFGPLDRKEQRYRVAQESLLVAVADFTDELDQRIFEQRLDPGPRRSPGSQPVRPFSRPQPPADRRQSAGLFAYCLRVRC
jgi:hypothetical protein